VNYRYALRREPVILKKIGEIIAAPDIIKCLDSRIFREFRALSVRSISQMISIIQAVVESARVRGFSMTARAPDAEVH